MEREKTLINRFPQKTILFGSLLAMSIVTNAETNFAKSDSEYKRFERKYETFLNTKTDTYREELNTAYADCREKAFLNEGFLFLKEMKYYSFSSVFSSSCFAAKSVIPCSCKILYH